MTSPLKKEFEFFIKNHDLLVSQYLGKYVVIKGGVVLGSFDSEIEAISETSKKHELGTFLVQLCNPGTDSFTQTYHSRVAFA